MPEHSRTRQSRQRSGRPRCDLGLAMTGHIGNRWSGRANRPFLRTPVGHPALGEVVEADNSTDVFGFQLLWPWPPPSRDS